MLRGKQHEGGAGFHQASGQTEGDGHGHRVAMADPEHLGPGRAVAHDQADSVDPAEGGGQGGRVPEAGGPGPDGMLSEHHIPKLRAP